jgi:hypothetical protein
MQGLIYFDTQETLYKSIICAKGQFTRKKSYLNSGDVGRNLYFYNEFKSGFDTWFFALSEESNVV